MKKSEMKESKEKGMKTEFTKEYIMSQKGCYSKEEVEKIKCINDKKITLKKLYRDLPIKDFTWFLVRKCDLSLTQKKELALYCAKLVLPVYEKKYPEDSRVRECIEATEKYIKGEISRDDLIEKKRAADAAAAANAAATYATYASASDAAAYANASAAANAAATYASAAYTAAYATYADAADAADAAVYRKSIWKWVENQLN